MEIKANHQKNKGFTLIEVLLVIVMIGLMVAAIQFNVGGNKPEAKLQQESARFAGIFDIASDYALLNNVEIGLVIDKNSYQFVGYDGVRWSEVADNDALAVYQLPEEIKLSLVLDDLPIDEPSLIDAKLFAPDEDEFGQDDDTYTEEEQDFENDSEADDNKDGKKKRIIPQVYILSGGDITPFMAEFTFIDNDLLSEEIQFNVIGSYTTPVKIEGPIIDGRNVGAVDNDVANRW
jgi:general secretion pathway protein H